MPAVTNIAAYKFARLDGLKPLRAELLECCEGWGLKGTILLSTEGVNLFVAGARAELDELLGFLRGLPGLETLAAKYSESEQQPFRRMLVRIKKEIISFGVEGIDPCARTSPKLAPATLKQWLDEGRPVTLYDTRNDYEVKLGTFKNALPAGITHFREFPRAVAELPEEMKRQPIVMFCTGGIRCEKAGPYMEREGFAEVYQLDGGILKYFEECGGAHYDGECFVFDHRVGVDAALEETESSQCYACQTPLTPMDQRSPLYQAGKYCPYCYKPPAEDTALRLTARRAAIARAAHPLPGSVPYDNYRPLRVTGAHDGATVIEFLSSLLGHHPREVWEGVCAAGRLLDDQHRRIGAEDVVRGGQKIIHLVPGTLEPVVSADIELLHEDEALIIIHKPAPIPAHASGNFNRNTLQHILRVAYAPEKPRSAHRLDANTTGVMVWTRTRHFASQVQPQFSRGEVEKLYLVRVHGHPREDECSCDEPIREAPGAAGVRETASDGLPARTLFRVVRREADGTSLLEARPLTGRTNQIRIHARALGHAVVGDPLYLPAGELGDVPTLAVDAPPLCLHAWKITLTHPISKERVSYEAPAPEWAEGRG